MKRIIFIATMTIALSGCQGCGNTIHLADGSYSESGRLTINPGVSIQGASMEGTIIHLTYHNGTAEDACFYLYSSTLTAGNQSISYLTLDGGNTGGKAILVRRRHNVDITHVTVKDFLWGGIHYRNQDGWRTPPAVYASGSEVIECIITNCSDRTYASYDPGNLRIDGQMNFDVFEVEMRNNQRPAGSGIVFSGVAFSDVKVYFLKNGELYPCEFSETAVFPESSEPGTLPGITIVAADAPNEYNASLLYKNILILNNGLNTSSWVIAEDPYVEYTLIGAYLKCLASRNRVARQVLTGTIKGAALGFDTLIRHEYNSNREFEIFECSWDIYEGKWNITLIEWLPFINRRVEYE